MKTKLHFGILIILFSFLGTYLEQATAPNQQVVIQFSDENISEIDAQNTVTVVKTQLQRLGVEHIQIKHNQNGELKITYYSDSEVEQIQNVLLKENRLKFADHSETELPSDFLSHKNGKNYELNISQIQNSNDVNWDFERIEVVELHQKSEHSYNPKVNTSGVEVNYKLSNSLIKVAVKTNYTLASTIDRISYKIPEVRAGPSAIGTI